MVRNLWPGDIALLELLAHGQTDAPQEVRGKLLVKGYITIEASGPKLTRKGRTRAERLKPAEHDLRLMFAGTAAGSGPSLRAIGGASLHIGSGSSVAIRPGRRA